MNKRIEVTPAWDKRNPDPKKNYGIGAVEIAFYLIGEKGAVQFVLSTGWVLPETLFYPYTETKIPPDPINLDWQNPFRYQEELAIKNSRLPSYPNPMDLGYHSKKPMYEDQFERKDCHLIGDTCYYDGSGLNAIEPFEKLLRGGSEGLFVYLEEYYKEVFNGE